MKVKIISVGTELLEGKVNQDVHILAEKLYNAGFDLSGALTVGDDVAGLKKAVISAIKDEGADILIITGGLGPTFDDITVETVASAISRKTYLDPELLKTIKQKFEKRKLDYSPSNDKQAYVISGAKIIENPYGTAVGQMIEVNPSELGASAEISGGNLNKKILIFLLPGPPREMKAVYEKGVEPVLFALPRKFRKNLILKIAGMPESAVDEKIRPLIDKEQKSNKEFLRFTILCHSGLVEIKATVTHPDDEMVVDDILSHLKEEFYSYIGAENIYSDNHSDTLESVIGRLLMKNKMTLAVAESCTAGLLASRITSVPGSSYYFTEGYVVYSNDSKIRHLGVKKETLEKYGSVSKEVAAELLEGIKRKTPAHCAISIVGYAGPTAKVGKEAGLVYIGVATPLNPTGEVKEYRFSGGRAEVREKACVVALDNLRRQLLKIK